MTKDWKAWSTNHLPWPPGQGHRPICSSAHRGGSNLSEGSGLRIQFLDTESASRISWPADRQVVKSPLFVAINGQRGNSILPSETCNGSSAGSEGLQRKEGFIGVFKKSATERDARFDLLYLDECEVHLHPTLTKVWTLKGTRPLVPAAGKNHKLCLYGAFNYKRGQVHYETSPKKNADCFAQFLRQLLSSNKNRFLVLSLEDASYHRTSEILYLLTEHQDHVFVVWLPKYSRQLNMIKGLWGYLKQSALHNYFYGDLNSLEADDDGAFKELQQHPEDSVVVPGCGGLRPDEPDFGKLSRTAAAKRGEFNFRVHNVVMPTTDKQTILFSLCR